MLRPWSVRFAAVVVAFVAGANVVLAAQDSIDADSLESITLGHRTSITSETLGV